MPDAELPIVGERLAKETPVVGRTREGHRQILSLGIYDSVYTTAEITCLGIEIDTT